MQSVASTLYRRMLRYSQARAKAHRLNTSLDSTADERRIATCWANAWHQSAIDVLDLDALDDICARGRRLRR